MESQEQQVIDGLFDRLKQAEEQTGERDDAAARHIAGRVQEQPHAPYYMAQAMLIQEAALKKINAQVADLEQRLAAAERGASNNRGSFLSGLFGGGSSAAAAPSRPNSTPPGNAPPSAGSGFSRGGGFLGGALQTAAGVAGGIVVADMLTGLFHHSQPEEIVEVINEPSSQPMDSDFASGFDSKGYDGGDANWGLGSNSGYDDTGYDPGSNDSSSWGDDDFV